MKQLVNQQANLGDGGDDEEDEERGAAANARE